MAWRRGREIEILKFKSRDPHHMHYTSKPINYHEEIGRENKGWTHLQWWWNFGTLGLEIGSKNSDHRVYTYTIYTSHQTHKILWRNWERKQNPTHLQEGSNFGSRGKKSAAIFSPKKWPHDRFWDDDGGRRR